jgi:ribosome maturation factor RimP
MDFESIKARLTELIEPMIKDNFMEIADMDIVGGPLIRLFIGKTGGNITLDEIADISRKVRAMLDAAGPAWDDFALEVSSPGLNRHIKKKEDFARFAGKKVKIVTREKVENERVFSGILLGISGDSVTLNTGYKEVVIDFNNIRKARLDEELF